MSKNRFWTKLTAAAVVKAACSRQNQTQQASTILLYEWCFIWNGIVSKSCSNLQSFWEGESVPVWATCQKIQTVDKMMTFQTCSIKDKHLWVKTGFEPSWQQQQWWKLHAADKTRHNKLVLFCCTNDVLWIMNTVSGKIN